MIDRNDPRLTAYALGEMNQNDRADFEKALASDPAARAEVDAIRALGGRLETELAGAPAPALTEAQRASVATAARRRVPIAILLMPVAACLLAAVAIFWPEPGPAAVSASHEEAARRYGEHRTGLAQAQPAESPIEVVSGGRRLDDGARTDFDESFFGSPANPAKAPPGVIPGPSSEARGLDAGKAPRRAEAVEIVGAPAPGMRKPNDPEPPAPPGEKGFVEHFDTLEGAPPPGDAGGADTGGSPAFARSKKEAEGKARAPVPGAAAPASDPAPGVVVHTLTEADREQAGRVVELERQSLRDRIRAVPEEPFNREAYDRIVDNPFLRVAEQDSSTFSIDVDTASYANVRRFLLQEHRLPPRDAVRIEEMVNYFPYRYEPPAMGSPHPFRAHVEVAACPWDATHRLARIAIKGKTIDHRERPASNLVFLVDVSGSMNEPNKLPLVQASLRMLAENLGERDRIAIVVYAGRAGLVLPSTGDKRQVIEAIERLRAGGSTAGAEGIQLAYEIAAANFIREGVNRVILCTDGDFNVGVSDDGALTRLIEEKAKTGVFLSVLGFGTGNYQDAKMQKLADKGNGNHAYVDSILEAKKVLGEEMSGTLVTIAKDVKIQVFFNPRRVAGFRLIGYENRLLAKQDFNDDTKDAGEIGAGHSVTALYELVLAGSEVPAAPPVDENPFVAKAQAAVDSDALFQLRLRYKQPDGDTSELIEEMVRDGAGTFDTASADFRWASAVASFGMSLRDARTMGLDAVLEIAKGAAGDDKYRQEFLKMVETAKLLRR